MRNNDEKKLPRRAFLRGAAGVLGATVFGATGAMARTVANPSPKKGVALSYWDGSTFISADKLPSGDSTLDSVKVLMQGEGRGALRSVEVHALVATAKSKTSPFRAWVSAPNGSKRTRFTMSVREPNGLLLTANETDGSHTDMIISLGIGSGPKLREGAYVLTEMGASLKGAGYVAGSRTAPLIDGSGSVIQVPYLLIVIERA